MFISRIFVFLAVLTLPSVLLAHELKTIDTPEGPVDVRVFPATGKRLLLGFPFDESQGKAVERTAQSLAGDGIEVWMTDFLTAFMLPNLHSSVHDVPTDAVLAIIKAAVATGKKVYLIASGPDTELLLRGAHAWQQKHHTMLEGGIMLYPRLFKKTPTPGEIPEYVDAVGHTRLPLMILEGGRTPNRWGTKELVLKLEKGGSPVYAKLIPGIRGYFYNRQDANRSEQVVTSQLAGLIKVSMYYLENTYAKAHK